MILFSSVICFITLTMFLWFRSDALYEYYKTFHIRGIKCIDEYVEKSRDGYFSHLVEYLANNHHSFWIKLITCPICLSVWLSAIFSFVTGFISCVFIINVAVLFLYFMLVSIQKDAMKED